MLRSTTKTDLRVLCESPLPRPHTAFQPLPGALQPTLNNYRKVLAEFRRTATAVEGKPPGERENARPQSVAARRAKDGRPSDHAETPVLDDKYADRATSPSHEVQIPCPEALKRKNHRPHPSLPPAKEVLSDYVPGVTLGHGSFASVKKAVHRVSSLPVAIKTYEKYRLIDSSRKKGVAREIKILSQLDHENIVKLLKVIEGPRHLHLIMEFVDGVPLSAYLRQKDAKRLTEADAREVFKQLAEGLRYLHERGVTHRDLKLQNVLIDQKRVVKIIDFGFSTQVARDLKMNVYCGTPNYMAPEIVERKEYLGAPADMWAAGVLLYTLLCGEFPFKGLNDRELYKRIQAGLFTIPPHVSTAGKELIAALLTMDPTQRPSANEVLEHHWLTGQKPSNSRPHTTPFRLRSNNPFAGYDQDILTRLVTLTQRNLGYTDAMLVRELKDDKSHVFNLYQRLVEVKTGS